MVDDRHPIPRRVFLQEQSKNDRAQAACEVVLVVHVVRVDGQAKSRFRIQGRCYYVAVATPQDRLAVESKRLQKVSCSR